MALYARSAMGWPSVESSQSSTASTRPLSLGSSTRLSSLRGRELGPRHQGAPAGVMTAWLCPGPCFQAGWGCKATDFRTWEVVHKKPQGS